MPRSRRGRGEGGVYQRESDGLWVATVSLGYDEHGKRRRLTAYGATKKEALDKLDEKKGRAKQGIVADADRLTMKDFLNRWLGLVKPKVAPHLVNRSLKLIGCVPRNDRTIHILFVWRLV